MARTAPLAPVVYAEYQPETDRYGGQLGLEIVHAIFHLDSHAAISLLTDVKSNPLVAAVSSGALLVRLGLGVDELEEVYREHVAWIVRELHLSQPEQPPFLIEAERALRRQEDRFVDAARIVNRWAENGHFREFGARLREAADATLLSKPLTEIYIDLQHLHLNRLGMSPRQEMSAIALGAAALRNRLLPL